MVPRPTMEGCLKIDLADPEIRRLMRQSSHGELHWRQGGADFAGVQYTWTGGALLLRFRTGGAWREQLINTEKTRPYFGGTRRWFICPLTNARVRALVLPIGATRWGGRRGHDAVYQSQRAGRDRYSGLQQLLTSVQRSEALDRRNAVRRLRRQERKAGSASAVTPLPGPARSLNPAAGNAA